MNEALITAITSAIMLAIGGLVGHFITIRKSNREIRKDDDTYIRDKFREVIELQAAQNKEALDLQAKQHHEASELHAKQLHEVLRQLENAQETINQFQLELSKVYGIGEHAQRNEIQAAQSRIESIADAQAKIAGGGI